MSGSSAKKIKDDHSTPASIIKPCAKCLSAKCQVSALIQRRARSESSVTEKQITDAQDLCTARRMKS